jgi:hypothetical protein
MGNMQNQLGNMGFDVKRVEQAKKNPCLLCAEIQNALWPKNNIYPIYEITSPYFYYLAYKNRLK